MPSPEPRTTEEMLDVVVRQAGDRRRHRTRQRRGLAAAAVLAAVGLVTVVIVAQRDDGDQVRTGPPPTTPAPTEPRAALTEPEGWTPMADSPLSGRARPATAWTGSEWLIWGGDGAFSDGGGGEPGRSDGAVYDPATDSWRPMAPSPLPSPENAVGASDYASAWTGAELLIWGGPGPAAAAYDPTADAWRTIDPGPLSVRTGFASVWTGAELVIVGGWTPLADRESIDGDDGATHEAAAYDPAADRWQTLPGIPIQRSGQAVWTGSEIVWLASSRDAGGTAGIAMALRPDEDAWRRIAQPPLATFTAPPVWTGSEVVAVGAAVRTDPARPNQGAAHAGAAVYDPASDRWTSLETPSDLRVDQLLSPVAVWSGREVLLLGNQGFGPRPDDPADVQGAAFDPAARTWRTLPEPGLSIRGGMASAWTGTELLVWGGARYTGFTSEPASDGARYRPGPGR